MNNKLAGNISYMYLSDTCFCNLYVIAYVYNYKYFYHIKGVDEFHMNKPSESEFPYRQHQVHFDTSEEGDLHAVDIYIENRLVNRRLFFSPQEANIHVFNLQLAIELGATFNDEGYWAFDRFPPHQKKQIQEQYYRLSKG